MTTLAQAMLIVFILAWCVGTAAHIYATRYWLPMWAAGFRKREKHKGYRRKALIGYGIFIAAIAVGFAASSIAELAGGWE